MFGTVKPLPDELKVKEYALYRGIYCGLCRAQGKCAGGLCRLTLSYDFVFLAAVGLSLNGEAPVLRERRCLVHPLRRRPMLEECETLRRCARASALLTHYKALDDWHDRRGPSRLGAGMLLGVTAPMRKRAGDCEGLDGQIAASLERLAALERDKCGSPDRAADAFGDTLGAVFRYVALDERGKRLGEVIGRQTGRWIYLADVLLDYAQDTRKGRYNPFWQSGLPTRASSSGALNGELLRMEDALGLIDFRSDALESIVKNIIYLGMPAQAERIFAQAYREER